MTGEDRAAHSRDHYRDYRPTRAACGMGSGAAGVDGGAILGTPGVPSWPASQGRPTANARAANGQSCLPGCISTAHVIPLALPVAQSEFAAAVWR